MEGLHFMGELIEASEILHDERIPESITIRYVGDKPEITAVDGEFSFVIRIHFSNGGIILVTPTDTPFLGVAKLPTGVTVEANDGRKVEDMTSPKDRASAEPTPDAGEIVVGHELPGLMLSDKFSGGFKEYSAQIIPSVYGDLFFSEDQYRNGTHRWQTVDGNTVVTIQAGTKNVLSIGPG